MQFGLFYEAPKASRYTHAERYAEMLDVMAYGETLGCCDEFDLCWLICWFDQE